MTDFFPFLIAVGYATKGTTTAKYLGVGSFFFPTGVGEEYDLTDVKVECFNAIDFAAHYMDPAYECLRELNPASAGDLNRYVYLNEAFLVDAFFAFGELTPEQKALAGWWKCPANPADLWTIIPTYNDELKLKKGDKLVNPRTAFLGQFVGSGNMGCDFRFTYAGQVLAGTSQIETGTAKYYFFQNYLPTPFKLTQIGVDCINPIDFAAHYMDPAYECIRELNPASAGDLNRYVYINEAFLKDAFFAFGELTPEQLALVGWWKCPANPADLWTIIPTYNDELKIKEVNDVTIEPGKAFLGQFVGSGNMGCDFHIMFPAAY